ncbi:MAG: hypothetical protein R2880_12025 [Deinococcales bacterium]
MFAYFSSALSLSSSANTETKASNYARNFFDSLRAQWQKASFYDDGLFTIDTLPSEFVNYQLHITSQDPQGQEVASFTFELASLAPNTPSVVNANNDYLRIIRLNLIDRKGRNYLYENQMVRPVNE